MKLSRVMNFVLVFALITAAYPLSAKTRSSQDDLSSRIHELLTLYSKKDVAGLMNLVGDGNLLVIGSGLNEVYTSKEEVKEFLGNDFKLWDSASFENPDHIFTRKSGDLVTAFFDAPFTMQRGGNQQTLTIRFATVWKKTAHGLKLIQSMNATPTASQ